MHDQSLQHHPLIGPSVHWVDPIQVLEYLEDAARLPKLWGGMVPGYDHGGDARLAEAYELLHSEGNGTIRWSDIVEQVPGMQEEVWTMLQCLVHAGLEGSIKVHLSLVEPRDLLHLAIGGEAQVRVGHVQYPHSIPLRASLTVLCVHPSFPEAVESVDHFFTSSLKPSPSRLHTFS